MSTALLLQIQLQIHSIEWITMPDIHHQFPVAAPMQAVFDAFTTPAGLDSWWTLQSEGLPVSNSLYRLYFGPEYDWLAQVIHLEGNTQMTWRPVRSMEDGCQPRLDLS
ncbi:MAG: hypothetical protein U0930_07145 [Pirellulales bacterium]